MKGQARSMRGGASRPLFEGVWWPRSNCKRPFRTRNPCSPVIEPRGPIQSPRQRLEQPFGLVVIVAPV